MQIKKKEGSCIKGHYKFTIRDAKTGKIKRTYEYENLIPTVGRTLLANNLTDASPDNDPRVNYVALGTGVTAPTNADTTLETESYRNTVASETNDDNIGFVTGFFSAPEVNGTFREAGLFCDGGAGADTGILFSRVAINVTKTALETLTIDWTITIS